MDPYIDGQADARVPRGMWFLVVLLMVLAAVGIGVGGAAYSNQTALEDDVSAAQKTAKDAQQDAAKAKQDLKDLQQRMDDLEATSGDTEEDDTSTDDVDLPQSVTDDDQTMLESMTRDAVKQGAVAGFSDCALITFVGATEDGEYVVTHADLETDCSPKKTDPGEFLWHRTDTGDWEEVDAKTDDLTVCGPESAATDEVKDAIDEICAQ
jgi:hypothetical protein